MMITYSHRACNVRNSFNKGVLVPKICYPTEIAARMQAFRFNTYSLIKGLGWKRQRPYKCPECPKWHLTSRTMPWVP